MAKEDQKLFTRGSDREITLYSQNGTELSNKVMVPSFYPSLPTAIITGGRVFIKIGGEARYQEATFYKTIS